MIFAAPTREESEGRGGMPSSAGRELCVWVSLEREVKARASPPKSERNSERRRERRGRGIIGRGRGQLVLRSEESPEFVGADVYDDLATVGEGYGAPLFADDDDLGVGLLREAEGGAVAQA